jgi:ATP-binding protein involved in chromosome partitioning
VVATEPEGEHARIYRDIASKVRDQLVSGPTAGRPAPRIVIEA